MKSIRGLIVALVTSVGVLVGTLATPLSAAAAGWSTYSLTGANAASGQAIASVSRQWNTTEIWWIQADGSIEDGYHYDGQFPAWKFFQLAPPGSAMAGGAIRAVSRAYYTMEVFWEGPDASIQHASWYAGRPGTGWTGQAGIPALVPVAGAGSLPDLSSPQPLAVVSRASDTIELWWIAPNGSVQDANYYDETGQWTYYTVASAGSAGINSAIAAVSRAWNTWEIFWTGWDRSVQDNFWYQGGTVGHFTIAPAGSAGYETGLAAVSRAPNTWEIFWSDWHNAVQDAYWYEGGPHGQFQLAPPGSTGWAGFGRQLAAVSRHSTMEVFWSDPGASLLHDYSYSDGAGWSSQSISGSPVSGSANNDGVTGLSRSSNTVEVWWLTLDGSIQDSSLYA
jgi:hypothetical protein